MSKLYRKIYTDQNIIDRYKIMLIDLANENRYLRSQVDKDETNKRIQQAIKLLSTTIKHYKDIETNNAIIRAIAILKGE